MVRFSDSVRDAFALRTKSVPLRIWPFAARGFSEHCLCTLQSALYFFQSQLLLAREIFQPAEAASISAFAA